MAQCEIEKIPTAECELHGIMCIRRDVQGRTWIRKRNGCSMQSLNKKKCTYQHNYNGKFWVEVHGSWYRGIINILKMIHFGVEVHGSFCVCVCVCVWTSVACRPITSLLFFSSSFFSVVVHRSSSSVLVLCVFLVKL